MGAPQAGYRYYDAGGRLILIEAAIVGSRCSAFLAESIVEQ